MYLSLGYSFASLVLVSLAGNPSFVSFSFLRLFVVSLYAWPVDGFVNSKSGSLSLLFKKFPIEEQDVLLFYNGTKSTSIIPQKIHCIHGWSMN
jgi:hypothetical protein